MKTFNFIIRGTEYEVEIKSLENSIAKIEVNGSLYNVELQKEVKTSKTPILIRKPVVLPPGSEQIKKQAGSYKVKAPLPGNIMKVFVKEGDKVNTGDNLLIYEAMKMENTLKSEKAGTIKSLSVKEGDAVLQDALLLEIEL
ncbi:MAG: acetyl-CoA carboxylase biotin carboxyl carrier protein subunit [Bacteroidetes bacterium]|jgi:biotin carboxyl carrier protein|nr:MAG: acetyl-CoA carboxylase biotin carboxyl carrier protein subunit [Bacteroidota bacterium]